MSVNHEAVQEISAFNRYYSSLSDVMNRHIADGEISLSALRVLASIKNDEQCTAGKLVTTLGIDGGYLSRMLKTFEKEQLVSKKKSAADGRTWFLQITAKGKKLLDTLEENSTASITNLLQPLSEEQQLALATSMRSIRHILSDESKITAEDITFRRHLQPGDAGYLIYLQGSLFAKEAGYNVSFETDLCKTFYEFLEAYNASKDQIFLALHGDRIVGSIAVTGLSRYAAHLRWFLVHPDYRGLGLGTKLLQEATAFCREKGFQKAFLMSTNKQEAANSLYRKNGFRKSGEKHMNLWGQHLYEERYDLDLDVM
jgi:DNA-binding MarR family transcriptional regulator/ribosomal protein S18 acetylase RimI-like enzyme